MIWERTWNNVPFITAPYYNCSILSLVVKNLLCLIYKITFCQRSVCIGKNKQTNIKCIGFGSRRGCRPPMHTLKHSMGKKSAGSMSLFCVNSGMRDPGSFHPHQHLIPLTLVGVKPTSLWFLFDVLMNHGGEHLATWSFLSIYFYCASVQLRVALPSSGALSSGSSTWTNIIFVFFLLWWMLLVFCVRIFCLSKCLNFFDL